MTISRWRYTQPDMVIGRNDSRGGAELTCATFARLCRAVRALHIHNSRNDRAGNIYNSTSYHQSARLRTQGWWVRILPGAPFYKGSPRGGPRHLYYSNPVVSCSAPVSLAPPGADISGRSSWHGMEKQGAGVLERTRVARSGLRRT